jgi:hypothetical protein
MSNLKGSVQAAIASYVQSERDTHTQVDVLRMIRDQASLLYERQVICDALDSDPMERLQQVKPQIKRIQVSDDACLTNNHCHSFESDNCKL